MICIRSTVAEVEEEMSVKAWFVHSQIQPPYNRITLPRQPPPPGGSVS